MGNRTREQGKAGILYPMLIIAALAVIAFGVLGVVAMSGVLPRNDPMSATHTPHSSASPRPPAADDQPTGRSPRAPAERAAKSGASSDNAPSRVTVPASTTL
jgi:hypothetical protein